MALRSFHNRRIATVARSTARTAGGSRLVLVSVVVCVLALLVVPGVRAESAWLGPATVSREGDTAGWPQVAFDRQGDAVVVWERAGGAVDSVFEASRAAGGAWQAPVMLASCGERYCEPHVAFDSNGDAIVVWDADTGAHSMVQSAYRPAGGAWQPPVDLSPDEAPGADHPQLAVDGQGDGIAIWDRPGPWGGAVQEAFRPAGGAWQAPVNVAETGSDPQIAFDGQGNALALWQSFEGGVKEEWVLESAFMPVGGTWQAPVTVSAPDFAGSSRIAVDAKGDAVVVWDGWTHGFLSHQVAQAAYMPAGGTWQAPVDLSEAVSEYDEPNHREASEPSVAVDEQGAAIATWGREAGVQASSRPADGAWEAPVDLSPPDESARNPQVAFDGQGNALAVWSLELPSGFSVVQSAFKPSGGTWQAPGDISGQTRGAYPQIAVDGQSDAVAAWTGGAGIEVAGYAAAGPRLNSLSIPAAGTVSQPVSFSVSPLDVWSLLGETTWSFGDGSTASGTITNHTYTAAGTYQVTLRAADTLGNITSTTSTITIAPEPPPASPPSEPLSSSSEPSTRSVTASPMISTVRQSRSSWRERGKSPLGTTFSLTLNVPATLRLRFIRNATGRLADKRCGAETAKNLRHPPCSRLIPAGVLSLTAHQGANTIGFRGRLSRSDRLHPGRYTLVATATSGTSDPSGSRSLDFTIME
jgi:hypothetical protein